MNTLYTKLHRRSSSGFTLLELLVVIAILGVVTTASLAYLSYSRKRAIDASTKTTLSNVRTAVAQESLGQLAAAFNPGTVARQEVDALAAKLKYTSAQNGTAYDYQADTTGYVAIFPLEAGPTPYWCIDAEGSAKGTSGLLATTGAKKCDNASRDPNAIQNTITLTNFNINWNTTGPLTLTPSMHTELRVWAFSNNSTIQKVEYFRDSTLINVVTPTPAINPTWLYWDTYVVPEGTYSITARATDAAGNTKTSSPIVVTIDHTL